MVTNGTRVTGQGTSQVAEINDEVKEQLRLRKACDDFETFLVSYLLQQMWQAAEAIGGEKPFMSQAYRDLFTFDFAKSLVPSMKLGIAEALYRELSGK